MLPHPNHVPYPPEEHDARLKDGCPIAQAYEWIAAYALNLTQDVQECHREYYGFEGGREVTVKDLMDAADSHQGDGWGNYIVRGGTFEGEYVDPTFWTKYAILREQELDDAKQDSFFSCSC